MSRRLALLIFLTAIAVLLIAASRIVYLEIGRTFTKDPTVWEPEIARFEVADRIAPPPEDAILFVGSSSVRFWETLEQDMAPLPVFRRGFGGARLSDLVHHADRIILPYSPRAIVIHAGGNELNEVPGNDRVTPEEAAQDFVELIDTLRDRWPTLPLYYLALRPAASVGGRDALMALIEAECASRAGLEFLDASDVLTLPDGSADPALIRWDQIHLNAEGYARWAPPVRARLMRDLARPGER